MIRLLAAACAFLLCLPVLADEPNTVKPADDFSLGPIKDPAIDAGCALRPRGTDWETPVIFIDTAGGPPMVNINGKNMVLERLEVKDWRRPEYKADGLHVRVIYGWGKEGEGGATYNHARIVVTRNGRTKTFKAEGSCGC